MAAVVGAVLMLAVSASQHAAALRIGVATYEPDRVLGSSGMTIGTVAAHLLGYDNHTGSMIVQPSGLAAGVAVHDVILAHGVRACILLRLADTCNMGRSLRACGLPKYHTGMRHAGYAVPCSILHAEGTAGF